MSHTSRLSEGKVLDLIKASALSFLQGSLLASHLAKKGHPPSTSVTPGNGSNSGADKEKDERSPWKVSGEDGNIHKPLKIPRCPVRVASVCKVASGLSMKQ